MLYGFRVLVNRALYEQIHPKTIGFVQRLNFDSKYYF